MITKGRLFVVSELFFPEETSTAFVMTKIVNKLAEKYDDIEVVCGMPVYDNNTQKNDNYFLKDSVKVTRIETFAGSKNNLIQRSIRFVSLSFSMFFLLLKKVKRNDTVTIVTNPAPIILLASLLKLLRGMKLVILVHDVFPENTVPAGILKDKKSIVYKVLCTLFNKAYSSADKLIVVGRDMANVMKLKTAKNPNLEIEVIENWSENKLVIPKDNLLSTDKVVFQFAGNLGRVQGLKELLQVIHRSTNKNTEFHFVGEGAVKQEMIEYVSDNNLKNVIFQKGYKRSEQVEILNNTDISIVILSPGMFGLGVPSKTYNILAAGKPILYVGDKDSEVDLLIKDHEIGYSFSTDEKLLQFLDQIKLADKEKFRIMGERSRKLANSIYSEETILQKYQDAI